MLLADFGLFEFSGEFFGMDFDIERSDSKLSNDGCGVWWEMHLRQFDITWSNTCSRKILHLFLHGNTADPAEFVRAFVRLVSISTNDTNDITMNQTLNKYIQA